MACLISFLVALTIEYPLAVFRESEFFIFPKENVRSNSSSEVCARAVIGNNPEIITK